MKQYEAIIVGGGIGGASLAYFLTELGMTKVLILEKEEQPGYHATGRSAGALVEFDLEPLVLRMIQLGGSFLKRPPDGFCEHPILDPVGVLMMFQGELWVKAQGMIPAMTEGGTQVLPLTPAQVAAQYPVIDPASLDGALLITDGGHLDVHELLWSYIRHAKSRGAELRCGEEVKSVIVDNGRAAGVTTGSGTYFGQWVVDAAGPWATRIREMAGPTAVQVTPKRRTVITFTPPEGMDVRRWPFCANISQSVYFSTESAGLLASPMDEEPMDPCDARPDELGVAMAIEYLKGVAPTLVPRSLKHKWAGLRTFSPDDGMVIGEDPDLKGFFWLAGLGGSGIEASPAVGRIGAQLLVQGRSDLWPAESLSPARFTR